MSTQLVDQAHIYLYSSGRGRSLFAGWVCPLPPVENHLTVAVRAGERSFADARH